MFRHVHRLRVLRRFVLPLLRRINVGDITIGHHWTKDRVTLDFVKHKGYWYHGRRREMATMILYSALLRRGDLVLEIGGHIGYVAQYLAHLIGPDGRLLVFEPAPNNLPYLRKNTAATACISVIELAATDYNGTAKLCIDPLTGQNNSLLEHYSVFEENKQWAYAGRVEGHVIDVPCARVDDFLAGRHLPAPSFVKIDAEGGEYSILRGMSRTLQIPGIALMIEVTERLSEVFALLRGAGFDLFRPDKQYIGSASNVRGNVFAIRPDDPRMACFMSQPTQRRRVL